MAIKVRTLAQIISNDLNEKDYKTKAKLYAAAREIRNREVVQRDEQKKREKLDRAARQAHKRSRKGKMPRGTRRLLRQSGNFVPCRSWFTGCNATGFLKDKYGNRTLPHSACRGTGYRKLPKSRRR